MPKYLTVKEAAALVGKSASSIRRIIYPIIERESHADRDQIWPSPDDVKALRERGENFPWKISEELLRREVKDDDANGTAPNTPRSTAASIDTELIAMLRDELSIKNEQISKQSELIAKQTELMSGLSERLREGNVLIGTLQNRLSLTEGRPAKSETTVDATVAKTTKAKSEKSTTAEKSNKSEKGSGKAEKKATGFFGWLRS